MARTSLGALISRVRLLVGDAAGASQVFSDDAYQQALDESRLEVRWMALRPTPTFAPTGVQYLDFYSGPGAAYWEGDYVLQDVGYNDITSHPALAELDVGHFHFSAQPTGLTVRITGKSFDPYGAAVVMLERWAAQVALQFDVQGGSGQSFSRSQQHKQLLAQAQEYRSQACLRTGRLVQSDLMPEGMGSGPSVVYPSFSPTGW